MFRFPLQTNGFNISKLLKSDKLLSVKIRFSEVMKKSVKPFYGIQLANGLPEMKSSHSHILTNQRFQSTLDKELFDTVQWRF